MARVVTLLMEAAARVTEDTSKKLSRRSQGHFYCILLVILVIGPALIHRMSGMSPLISGGVGKAHFQRRAREVRDCCNCLKISALIE
jgi:hypothetical protein